MGKMRFNILILNIAIAFIAFFATFVSDSEQLCAQPPPVGTRFDGPQCYIQNTFPYESNPKIPTSHFGAGRINGAGVVVRFHAGVDYYYAKGTEVSVPSGCQIRLYSDGEVIWKSDPTGYGQYMFLDCAPGGVPVTLRYAHIAQYKASSSTIQQGRTGIETAGIGDHYHFEVLINETPGIGTPIDPDCVLGIPKNLTRPGKISPDPSCNVCPNGPEALNFCTNADAISDLLDHSDRCYGGNPKKNPGGETVDPSRLTGVEDQGNPGSDAGPVGDGIADDDAEDFTDPSDGDVFTGDVDILYPPITELPPITPPPADVPGIPGGDPNLAPSSGATPKPVSGCAADTWTAMTNQAIMEARREDLYNKRFIVKPDSVLEYSCFSAWTTKTSDLIGPIFSETANWDNLSVSLIGKDVEVQLGIKDQTEDPFPVETDYIMERTQDSSSGSSVTYDALGPNSLDAAIDNIITRNAQTYLQNNFNYNHLAGSTPVAASSAATCNIMKNVWTASKCKNFDGINVFGTLDQLATGTDPREFPPGMGCL